MQPTKERLRLLNLPAFETEVELSKLMNLEELTITKLVRRNSFYYRKAIIRKKSGEPRIIHAPSKILRAVQAWILRYILDKVEPHSAATGFRKGFSIQENTAPHRSNRYFVILDLKDFFPSIKFYQVFQLFHTLGYSRNASRILTKLCTCDDHLPQGGVTSPSISNLVTRRLDLRLTGLSNVKNFMYTRYADDLTFSSNNRIILKSMVRVIRRIIDSEGYTINERKFRVLGPRVHCSVTGLVKNSSEPKFSIGKRKKLEMRAVMHAMVLGKNISSKYSTEASLQGWLTYLQNIDSESYQQMNRYWHKLREKYNFTG